MFESWNISPMSIALAATWDEVKTLERIIIFCVISHLCCTCLLKIIFTEFPSLEISKSLCRLNFVSHFLRDWSWWEDTYFCNLFFYIHFRALSNNNRKFSSLFQKLWNWINSCSSFLLTSVYIQLDRSKFTFSLLLSVVVLSDSILLLIACLFFYYTISHSNFL